MDCHESRLNLESINRSEEFGLGRFVWSEVPITQLLRALVPFAELHFDAVHPVAFTANEKIELREWLQRGGFILAFEDTYPYEQEEFRAARSLPVFDFFTKELPALNPRFTISRVDDTHPIFHAYYDTETIPSIRREMLENSNYRGRTVILFEGRIVAFFMGRYNSDVDGRWEPLRRPFPRDGLSNDIRSYHLILNVYVYALNH